MLPPKEFPANVVAKFKPKSIAVCAQSTCSPLITVSSVSTPVSGYISSIVIGIPPLRISCQVYLFCQSVEAVVLVTYVFARVKHVLYFGKLKVIIISPLFTCMELT